MNHIKELRLMLEKTQQEIADILKVDRTTYTKWESNVHSPDIETLQRLANYFNVTVDYLLDSNETEEKSIESQYPLCRKTNGQKPSIGQQIKLIRKLKKLTQLQLSQKANISRTYLADIENDAYNPSIKTLKAISNALSVNISIFFPCEKTFSDLVNTPLFTLYTEINELSEEETKMVLLFIKFMKEQNKKK